MSYNCHMSSLLRTAQSHNRHKHSGSCHADSAQQEVYDGCVLQLTEQLLQGYNATVLAYGRTGSGKTFTMGTSGHDFSGCEGLRVSGLQQSSTVAGQDTA